jgi:hypothetical protein
MRCGFCGESTAPLGISWTVPGQRVVVLQCSSCQAVLGAANEAPTELLNHVHNVERQLSNVAQVAQTLERKLRNLEHEVSRLRRG